MRDEPCPWCDFTTPNPLVPCVCHRPDCACLDCTNRRVWSYLLAGPDAWNDEDDHSILGLRLRQPSVGTPPRGARS